MFYKAPCKIKDGVWALGNELFPCFLVECKGRLFLFEPSLSGAYPELKGQMGDLGCSLEDVEAVVVLHSHYDHVMMLFPLLDEVKIPVYAHPSAKGALGKLKVLSFFRGADDYSSRKVYGTVPEYSLREVEFEDIERLKDMGLEVYHLPGHSPCSVGIGCGGALFVSDAIGFFGKELGHSPLFFYSYDLYMESIEKVGSLAKDYDVVIIWHNCYFEGNEALEAVERAREEARALKDSILSRGFTPDNPDELFRELYVGEYLYYPPEIIKNCAVYLIKRALEAS